MSNVNKQNLNQEAVPFFARFLEGQINFLEEISEQEAEAVGGGSKITTKKYPSDQEDGSGGGVVTQKFPSDQEDGSGGGAVTLKYPSDGDDRT